jgi:hypothetical protein
LGWGRWVGVLGVVEGRDENRELDGKWDVQDLGVRWER